MNSKVNLSALVFGLSFAVTGFAQNSFFNSLESGLKNPSTTSISFFSEDQQIGEFISRSSEFDRLSRVQIKRYSNSLGSQLVLATVSGLSDLEFLNIQLTEFSIIPPYLDQFEGLKTLQITSAYQDYRREPVRLIATNGGANLMIEVYADERTALEYMDRFFEAYPGMVQNIENFTLYPLRTNLERVETSYRTFDPLLLPKSSSAMISPLTRARIVTREGSVITIPRSAFVDAAGNPVNDSVQIDFTYFSDQLDIALARIGMHTDTGGSPALLESAGMFEVNASRNGELLQLAENKTIEVDMVSSDEGTYNLYAFDDNQGDWDEVASNNLPANGASEFTKAFDKFNKLYNDFSTTREPETYGQNSGDYFASNEYIRFHKREGSFWAEYDIHDDEQVQKLTREYRRSATSANSDLAYFSIGRESDQHRTLREHYFFKFYEQNRSMPEMRDIRRYVWYSADAIGSSEFRGKYGRSKAYADFIMNYDSKAEVFEFVFKDAAGRFDTLRALPFLGMKKTMDAKAIIHQDILARYAELFRASRKKNIKSEATTERKYTREYQSRLANQAKKERRAWERVKPLMTTAESEMSFEKWFAHFDKLRLLQSQILFAQNTNAYTVVRAVSLDKMGYWNVDKPLLKQNRFENVNVLAQKAETRKYLVSAIFLDFNSALTTDHKSKIDREGGCAYLLYDGNKISWITPSESAKLDGKKLEVSKPFVPIAEVDLDDLRAQLFSY